MMRYILFLYLFFCSFATSTWAQDEPCDHAPTVTVNAFGFNDIEIYWQAESGVLLYNIRYRIWDSSDEWTEITNYNNTQIALGELLPGTTYEFQVQGFCNGNTLSPFSSNTLITTLSCDILPPFAELTADDTSICGGGIIQLQATGGNTYLWQPGNLVSDSTIANPTITLAQVGSYPVSVQVTNQFGCTETASAVLVVLDEPEVSVSEDAHICAGDAVSLQASGANAYNWSPSVSLDNPNIANPIATPSETTTYTVTGTTTGCSTSAQVTIFVEELSIDVVNVVNATGCNTNDGAITIIANVPQGVVLEYSIDGGETYSTDYFFSDLSDGVYKVMVRADNGCEITYENNPVVVETQIGLMVNNVNVIQPNCSNDGYSSIKIIAEGGNEIMYSIDAGETFQTESLFENVAAGTYNILVKNELGCSATYTTNIHINDFSPIELINVATQDDTCIEGEDAYIHIEATGGVGNLQYSIDGGNTYSGNPNFNNLGAGTYLLSIIDGGDCVLDSPPLIVLNATPPVGFTTEVVQNSECQSPNGAITVHASGGNPPYSFAINNAPFSIDSTFANLAAGTYTISVTDNIGCDASSSINVGGIVPVQLGISVNPQNLSSCVQNNGSISISVLGGTSPYQYSIDGGETFQNNGTFEGLAEGAYQIYVEDANGCNGALGSSVNLLPPPYPQITAVNAQSPQCAESNDGEISVLAYGGSGLLAYSIDNGTTWTNTNLFLDVTQGTYHILVRDQVGCEVAYDNNPLVVEAPVPLSALVQASDVALCGDANGVIGIIASGGTAPYQYSINGGENFTTDNAFIDLPVGDYAVAIIDAHQCIWYSPEQTFINDPGSVFINEINVQQNTDCLSNNASIEIIAEGGNTLVYSINGGNSWNINNVFENLPAGNYQIQVLDTESSCSVVYPANPITILPGIVVQEIIAENPTCFDVNNGSIEIMASYVSDLEYSIDGGTTWQSEAVFQNLAAGTYTLALRTSDESCEVSLSSINLENPPALEFISVVAENASACGVANGSISVNVIGGTGTLVYSINNGDNFTTVNIFENLGAGNYNIVVKDTQGCSQSYSETVSITEPNFSISTQNNSSYIICGGESITLSVSGAQTYAWSPANGLSSTSSASVVATPSQNTTYTVVGFNGSGCSDELSFTINVGGSANPVAAFETSNTQICVGDAISFNNLSENAETYQWTFLGGTPSSSSEENPVVQYNEAGVYDVILEVQSCNNLDTYSLSSYVVVNPYPSFNLPTSINVCEGDAINLTASGAQNYIWYYNDEIIGNTATTNFTPEENLPLKIYAENGNCTDSTFVDVTIVSLPSANIQAEGETTICSGENVVLQVDGNDTYTWQPADFLSTNIGSEVTATPTETTTFSVIASNEAGCSQQGSILITVDVCESSDTVLKIPNTITPNSDNKNDTWVIGNPENLALSVKIYNRWGNLLYESDNYNNSWNGIYNGNPLPQGTYYYTLETPKGSAPITGTLTILY
ncbi:MAG: gliding motility-associated C-terminal domain-containing protein [Chitinophagales bacterium]|nr:gliding motility-associated C-terminal domain-containing protein [Bacteroidota bacterium]MCB9042696.1 gliding motility-associated C-terminal domain-containing protein [Chitinophagales bacterium]